MTCEIHLKLHIHRTYNIESANVCPRMGMQLTNKGNCVLYLDKDLVVEKFKEFGFSLSKTLKTT